MAFTNRFSTRADAYAAGRPSYPAAAIDAILAGLGDPAQVVVADVGAGTGIASRLIAERGPRVLAIEPNAAMREAAKPNPHVEWIDATAEHTTLGDRSVDAVTAFQAWHWVDHAIAFAEVRRVVRPGGRFAVVYNERDERDPFTAGYGEIVRRYATDATEARRTTALAGALAADPAKTTRLEFRNRQTLDRAGVHARAESTSYLPQTGTGAQALHAELAALLDRFAVTAAIDMHHVTTVVLVDLGN